MRNECFNKESNAFCTRKTRIVDNSMISASNRYYAFYFLNQNKLMFCNNFQRCKCMADNAHVYASCKLSYSYSL